MNSNALAQLREDHVAMSNLHRVSLRSSVFISLMSTSLGGKKDRPSSVSSFLGTTLLDNPKTRIFEILSACGICRPYFSTMQLMKGISLGGAPLLENKVEELVGLMSGGVGFVWSVISSRFFYSRPPRLTCVFGTHPPLAASQLLLRQQRTRTFAASRWTGHGRWPFRVKLLHAGPCVLGRCLSSACC